MTRAVGNRHSSRSRFGRHTNPSAGTRRGRSQSDRPSGTPATVCPWRWLN